MTIDFFFINIISLLGILGFSLALYIHTKKKSKKKLVCPMRSDCDTVIHSDYSTVFGIPVEILGMIYYACIGSAYTIISVLNLWSPVVGLVLLIMSACSVLFSLYLITLQIFVIKHWCAWCMSSALISLLILLVSCMRYGLF
jgi:uncharacterized membrane protein